MNKIKTIILMILCSFSIHCAKNEPIPSENAVPKIEISEPKLFVLGKWKYLEEATILGKRVRIENKAYLNFHDNETVVFEVYNSKVNYNYKVNENNEIEIELNYKTNLIVKRINDNEMRLKHKVEGGYMDFPILFSFTSENFRRTE